MSWGASVTNWLYGSAASDDANLVREGTDATGIGSIEYWNVIPANSLSAQKWKWVFMGVSRANEVLRILGMTEGLTPSRAAEIEAEARFLRAFFNTGGYLIFRNIPIITEDTEDPSKVTNTVDIVPHIIADLEFTWQNLPESQQQVGRPTMYAAMALAAKVHLLNRDYSSAGPLLDAIINSGRYSLTESFHDNFRIATNNNEESIFEIQASVNDGACCSVNAEMGIGINFPHGGDIGMCCGFHQPSQNLVNAFRVNEKGLPLPDSFNDADLKNDMGIESHEEFMPFDDYVDPRLDWTVNRWGIIEETLNDFARKDAEFRPQGFMGYAVFTEKDKYMPIPQLQINMQPGVLEQNPGY